MIQNKLYITNDNGEMVEICGDIKIESVEDTTFNVMNDNHLIYRFNPERQLTITTDAADIRATIPAIDKYNEKINALEKRITKLENKNTDEFDMRRIL